MRNKYEILLTLEVDHGFYNDDSFPGLEIEPHPRTAVFFRNFRLLFKRQGKSYVILQEGHIVDDEWFPIVEIDRPTWLVFQFKANDDMFQTKSAIEFFASKDQKLSLEFESDQVNLELLSFLRGGIELTADSGSQQTTFQLVNKTGEYVKEFVLDPDKKETVALDEPGLYDLIKNEEPIDRFIWSTYDEQFDGLIFLNTSGVIGAKLTYTFEPREIHWKYDIKLKHLQLNINDQTVVLEEENAEIEFEQLNVEDEDRIQFISKEMIRLAKNYDYAFYLKIDGEKELVNIGMPSLKNIGKHSENVNKLALIHYMHV